MSIPRPCARDLRLTNRNHTRVARAVAMCQHPGVFCWSDGYCHRDGACFVEELPVVERIKVRLREIGEAVGRMERVLDGRS